MKIAISSSAALTLLVATQQTKAFAPALRRVQPSVQRHQPRAMHLPPLALSNSRDDPDEVPQKSKVDGVVNVPARAAAVAALALALAATPLAADAAVSGGRMGGSFSAPRPSVSRPSRIPSSSSYGRGFSNGYASGYYSRPSVAITPGIGFGYNPFFGYGGGGALAVSRGPSFFDLIFFGGLLLAVVNIMENASAGSGLSSWADSAAAETSALGPGTSVAQLSVAVQVPDRDDPNSILSVLNRLSRTASTDSRMGIQDLSSQVAMELLRRKSSIASASSSYKHFGGRSQAARDYESLSLKERSKFERESVSKYGGVDYSSPGGGGAGDAENSRKATMAVVTIVMAIDGDSTKLPKITSISDVEEALTLIASHSKIEDCLQSVEVLWTPEERTETLSVRDVVADYPELRSV